MPSKKIGDTQLVARYGEPNVTNGKATGLQRLKPSLTFPIGDGMHVSIVPDDAWNHFQRMHESTLDLDDEATMHTDIADITFDEFHVTAHSPKASTWVTVAGAVTLSESDKTRVAALSVGEDVIGFVKAEAKTKK